MHRAELLRSSTNGKTGIHVNGLRGFCQAVACTVSPFLLFSSLPCLLLLLLSFLLLFPLLSIRLSFPSSPAPLLPVPSCFFSFSLFERAASFLFRAASDPRISVIRAASLEERERETHCLLTRVVVEWLVAFPLSPRVPVNVRRSVLARARLTALPVEIAAAPRASFRGERISRARDRADNETRRVARIEAGERRG